jgi:hypothetical protein
MSKSEFRIVSVVTKKDIEKFKNQFTKDIVQNGLDSILKKSLWKLRDSLLTAVNEVLRVASPEEAKKAADPTQVNSLYQPVVNPPKSEQEILKLLTGGKADLSKYNKAKDYTTLSETGIVFGQGSTGQTKANRINLRRDIEENETVSQQFAKANQFFKDAIFALPDTDGTIRYYKNPGLDISSFVKIKCSTMTGDGDGQPFTGMSPAQRFQRDRHTKGYATWTLRQKGVDFIRKSFIDLTDPIEAVKNGDLALASRLLDQKKYAVESNGDKTPSMKNEVDAAISGITKDKATKAYLDAVTLIHNIQISKKLEDKSATYSLVSYDANESSSEETEFKSSLMRAVRAWVVSEENEWFSDLLIKVEKLIKDFESGV